jgi:hypothetical protein
MTLDEAIEHAEEVGNNLTNNCKTKQCGLEHLQLAQWLKELKQYKEKENENKNRFCKQ